MPIRPLLLTAVTTSSAQDGLPHWVLYQARSKNLLEQVLNYTTTDNEDGDGYIFWVSGFDGQTGVLPKVA